MSYRMDHFPAKERSWQLFDRIAHRYDMVNHVLSGGLHRRWRRVALDFLPRDRDIYLLDLATGTGDLILTLCRSNLRIRKAVGMDLSRNMLHLAEEKWRRKGMSSVPALFLEGDARAIPAASGEFDAVTMAFGIRNVPDVDGVLKECHRVLKPQGKILLLEFSLPPSPFFRWIYLWYLRSILPRIGGWLSGEREAYLYLNQTIESFPCGEAFASLLVSAGFQAVQYHPLTFGIVTLYLGEKS